MLNIRIICVGKLKEKFYTSAADEYLKRLGAYAKVEIKELQETRRASDSAGEINACLEVDAEKIRAQIPRAAFVTAMCIEGSRLDSERFSQLISDVQVRGISKLCFIIGGSDGLHDSIKKQADFRLSMSDMTFPHHLARVMLLEQIYRAFKISEGGKYHK